MTCTTAHISDVTSPATEKIPGVRNALSAAFSDAQLILTGPRVDEASHDWSHHEWQAAAAVVRCTSTEDVARAVQICGAHGVSVVAHGAGTGLEGASNATSDRVVLDMRPMNRVLEIHERDFDAVVQPGVLKNQINHELRAMGLCFPAGPGVDASIGGMLSTRASGTNAIGYGAMRDNVLGLTVVLADGEIIRTGPRTRKSAAGYDLTHLFVGAEGTLGIITEAIVKVHPLPTSTAVIFCTFANLTDATDAVYEALRQAISLSRVELLDTAMITALNRSEGSSFTEQDTLIFEVTGSPESVTQRLTQLEAVIQASLATSSRSETDPEQIEAVWQIRHRALPTARALIEGASSWNTDVCVPISRLGECIAATRLDIVESGLTAPIAGHVGDGNFHLAVLLSPNDPDTFERARALNDRMVRRALDMDGTCTGEHGIGRGKRESLRLEHGPAVDIMERIKRALDPHMLLNPGSIFET